RGARPAPLGTHPPGDRRAGTGGGGGRGGPPRPRGGRGLRRRRRRPTRRRRRGLRVTGGGPHRGTYPGGLRRRCRSPRRLPGQPRVRPRAAGDPVTPGPEQPIKPNYRRKTMTTRTLAPLTDRLREAIAAAHAEAEHSGFMSDLLDGKLDVGAVGALAGQLRFVYGALEDAVRTIAGTPVGAAIADPRLERATRLD